MGTSEPVELTAGPIEAVELALRPFDPVRIKTVEVVAALSEPIEAKPREAVRRYVERIEAQGRNRVVADHAHTAHVKTMMMRCGR